jgi:PAS domain S-box-containing protein
MKKHFKTSANKEVLRKELIGLGDCSIRKSYYPQLQEKIRSLQDAKAKAEESERKSRVLFENMADGVLVADRDTKKFYAVNSTICGMLGYTREQLLKLGIPDIHPQEDVPFILEQFGKLVKRDMSRVSDIRVKRKDGSVFYAEISSVPITLGGKEYQIGVLRDITERKLTDASLQESENKFKTLSEYSLVGVYLIQDGIFIYANNCLAKIFGYSVEEIVNRKGPQDLIFPEDRPTVLQNIEKRITGELESIHYEFRGLKNNGEVINVEVYGSRTIYRGRPAVIGNLLDVTERRNAEEAIRASEAELYDQYFTQAAINMILSESLEDTPPEMILRKALNVILSIPWLRFESNGCIFLVQDKPGVLVMKAQSNLNGLFQEKSFDRVPLGKCLCGRAALTREIQFAERLECRHEIYCEDMPDHSHYVVPIVSGVTTLGVIRLCLKEGCARNQKEEDD